MLTRTRCCQLLAAVSSAGVVRRVRQLPGGRGAIGRNGKRLTSTIRRATAFPISFSPYTFPSVPEPRLADSQRLQDLVVDGKLVLSLDAAIALALENNGGSRWLATKPTHCPDRPAAPQKGEGRRAGRGAYQSTTLFSGSLEEAWAVAHPRAERCGGILGGGINSVGSTSCCDPRVRVSYGWSNAITPLNYKVVSGVSINTTHQASVARRTARAF